MRLVKIEETIVNLENIIYVTQRSDNKIKIRFKDSNHYLTSKMTIDEFYNFISCQELAEGIE